MTHDFLRADEFSFYPPFDDDSRGFLSAFPFIEELMIDKCARLVAQGKANGVVRWHKHVNFCAAPANKVKEYLGKHPKFGMFGSINTADACKTEGGTFFPTVFTWMIHVFPYEKDFKDIFSMNDDVAHVH